MARAIFQSYRPASANRSYLIPSDFYPAFDTPEQAKQAFRVFDKVREGLHASEAD